LTRAHMLMGKFGQNLGITLASRQRPCVVHPLS
jgi:hypothetical protein